MNRRDKVVLTLSVIVMGVGTASLALIAKTAFAAGSSGPSPASGASGVRSGIAYDGCKHFELADQTALVEWGTANAWRFLGYDLDEVKADPEPILVDGLQTLFPECPWPPRDDATFGPERISWSQALAQAKAAVAEYVAGDGRPNIAMLTRSILGAHP